MFWLIRVVLGGTIIWLNVFLAGSCSAFCISMLHIYGYKNYISPNMPISNPSPIGWLLQPQPLRMNEIEIAGILHVQYRASAVLHCIILYQNGHSGSKPPENVSKCIFLLFIAEFCGAMPCCLVFLKLHDILITELEVPIRAP